MADLSKAPKQFRAATKGAGRVDRTGGLYGAGLIQGVSLAARGEALGHDMWLDDEFLAAIPGHVNAYTTGMKSRFTHPSMSGDGMGSQLGVFTNARLDSGKPIADLHLMEAAHKAPDGDLAEYVMALAEESPDTFGVSIVFEPDDAATKEFSAAHTVENRFQSPDAANEKSYPHVRLKRLRAADVVDEPAANPDGMFSRGHDIARAADAALSYALGLTAERPEVCFDVDPDRLKGFVSRFLAQHSLAIEGVTPMAESTQTAAPVAVDPQAIRKEFASGLDKYQKAFGTENGVEWFKAGMDWAEAMELHAEHLTKQLTAKDAEIASLNERLASLKTGEEKPIEFSPHESESKPTRKPARYGASLGESLASLTSSKN